MMTARVWVLDDLKLMESVSEILAHCNLGKIRVKFSLAFPNDLKAREGEPNMVITRFISSPESGLRINTTISDIHAKDSSCKILVVCSNEYEFQTSSDGHGADNACYEDELATRLPNIMEEFIHGKKINPTRIIDRSLHRPAHRTR